MYHSKITGLGFYVPDNVVTNDDLSKVIDTNDEWIQERTGIKERRHIIPGQDTTTSMGVKAAKIALERSGVSKEAIDFVVFATLSPDYYFPGPGVWYNAIWVCEPLALSMFAINVRVLFMRCQLLTNILRRVCIKIY